MSNIFLYGLLMKRYVNPWAGSVEKGKLSILLGSYSRKFSKADGLKIVWKRESGKPFLLRDENSFAIGEVLLNVSDDVVNVVGKYIGPRRFFKKTLIEFEDVEGNKLEGYTFIYTSEVEFNDDEVFLTLIPKEDLPELFKKLL